LTKVIAQQQQQGIMEMKKKVTVYLMFVKATKSCRRYCEVADAESEVIVPRDEQTLGDVYLRKSAFPKGERPDRLKVRIYVG
jgi:hypothetical protein